MTRHLSAHTYHLIDAEFIRAHIKHDGHTPRSQRVTDHEALVILVEEVGEVARALTYDEHSITHLVAELLSVAAMTAAWLERLIDCSDP